jgi:predicted PurR-regulated permease PerM
MARARADGGRVRASLGAVAREVRPLTQALDTSAIPTGGPSVRAFRVLVVAALIVAWVGHAVLGPFIVAAVVAYAVSPLVATAERRLGWPRPLIVALGYVVALAALSIAIYFLAGQALRELEQLAKGGPDALASTLRQLVGSDTIVLGTQTISVAAVATQIQDSITHLLGPGDAINVARSVGESTLKTVLVLIVTFYFLVDGARFRDVVVGLFPTPYRTRTVGLLADIHAVLGKWLRGQAFLVVLVAAVVYVILGPILGLRYALALGILTGVLEIIPLVGPIIAAAIAATDAVTQGGLQLAGVVIVIYIVLRQVEDQLVMPVVIGRAVHLHPVVTIFAVLIGLEVYGVLGGLLGVPAAAAINVIFNTLYPHGIQVIEGADEEAPHPPEPPPLSPPDPAPSARDAGDAAETFRAEARAEAPLPPAATAPSVAREPTQAPD